MPVKKSAVPSEVFQLKATLLGTMPPIWRRLLVPADLTLAQLHDVLQAAMGWQDCHMHEFSAGQRRFGKPNPEDRLMGMPPVENERTVRLSSVLGRVGAKATYTYDGLATTMIPTLSLSRTSTRCSRPCVVAGTKPHAVGRQHGKQIRSKFPGYRTTRFCTVALFSIYD